MVSFSWRVRGQLSNLSPCLSLFSYCQARPKENGRNSRKYTSQKHQFGSFNERHKFMHMEIHYLEILELILHSTLT